MSAALHLGLDARLTRRRVTPKPQPLEVWCDRCGRDGHTARTCNLAGGRLLPLETPSANGAYPGDPAKVRVLAPGVTGEDLDEAKLATPPQWKTRWKPSRDREPPKGCLSTARAALALRFSVCWVNELCRDGKLDHEFEHGRYWPREAAVRAWRRTHHTKRRAEKSLA